MIHKTYFRKSLWLVSAILLLLVWACQKEEAPIPTASTQAMFTYEIQTFYQNPETGEMNYEVLFTNRSTMAAGFHWDFGNGQTSQQENPGTVVFDASGVYDVTLEVSPMTEQTDLHYNNLQATERLLLVPTIFFEGFDDPELETSFPPDGWLLVDNDGDGHNWYWDEFEGEFYILSRSWSSDDGPLTPDNWIITPQIDLTDISASLALEWEVTPTANQAQYRLENYSVLVSTTGTNVEDFTPVFTERLEGDMTNWVWIMRNIDVSQFAGEKIHIAFRHHDSTDLDRIGLTNIHLFQTGN